MAAVGAVLRILAAVTYAPALTFRTDSKTYLLAARRLFPGYWHPAGYPAFLWPWVHLHAIGVVPWLQHAMGMLLGLGIYALLRHLGIHPWLSALAAAPILLDAYQVDLEQFVMSETLFEALVLGAVIVAAWPRRPSAVACAGAGALLAAATLTRAEGLVLAVPLVIYLLVRRVGVLRTGAVLAAFLVPLALYATWYEARNGRFATTGGEGYVLYGRVMVFADCSQLDLRPKELVLCESKPESDRLSPNYYVWGPHSRVRRLHMHSLDAANDLLLHFSIKVIARQPGAYAATVLADIGHYFAPGRSTGRRDEPAALWQFASRFPIQDHVEVGVPGHGARAWSARQVRGRAAGFLRAYQRFGYTPGPLLALALALGLGLVGLWGARGGSRTLRAECFLLASTGILILLAPAMTVLFDYRYLLPSLTTLPPAGVLGFAVLCDRIPPSARWAGILAKLGYSGRLEGEAIAGRT